MTSKNDAFLKRLLATFRDEARERLQVMSADLLTLQAEDNGTAQAAVLERVFREAHSLKGAARSVNLTDIESVCQSLESVFAALKAGTCAWSSPLGDVIQAAVDGLTLLLSNQEGTSTRVSVAALNRQLDQVLQGDVTASDMPDVAAREADSTASSEVPAGSATPTPTPTPTAEAAQRYPGSGGGGETVRVSIAKLEATMHQAEALLVPKLAAEQRSKEWREADHALVAWEKQRASMHTLIRSVERALGKSGRVAGASGDSGIGQLLQHLEQEAHAAKAIRDRIGDIGKRLESDHRVLSGTVDELMQDMRENLMMPLDSLFESFPPMVRALARDQQKEVDLVIRGGDIEIDRRVIEVLRSPLIHILRNHIDHGIEKPAVRTEKGKPTRGTITLRVQQQDSGKAEITLSDDGAGIDADKLKTTAIERGRISVAEADQLSPREVLNLIFQSGISTSPIVTDLSGRGLGLAIVQEAVNQLGGVVDFESSPAIGTTFRIEVPLTLATFRGVLVSTGERLFVVPLLHVARVIRCQLEAIRRVKNKDTIHYGDELVLLVDLADALELPPADRPADTQAQVPIMIMENGATSIAIRVDEIHGEQEVMVKMLGRPLERVRNVAGACILGSGNVVPVLNAHDLMLSALRQASHQARHEAAPASEQQKNNHLLVVEDSITSRTLLKNILELAGYRVITAVDGMDAYTKLKSAPFDLVVSDVEMPRMDGFDLTARIRADKDLSGLPVVLVTSLAAREHQERGVDVGANAYIVKSDFDQSNLLDVIGRLI